MELLNVLVVHARQPHALIHKPRVELIVQHAQALHQNASMVHVHAPIITMLVELAAQHVQPANIVNHLTVA